MLMSFILKYNLEEEPTPCVCFNFEPNKNPHGIRTHFYPYTFKSQNLRMDTEILKSFKESQQQNTREVGTH